MSTPVIFPDSNPTGVVTPMEMNPVVEPVQIEPVPEPVPSEQHRILVPPAPVDSSSIQTTPTGMMYTAVGPTGETSQSGVAGPRLQPAQFPAMTAGYEGANTAPNSSAWPRPSASAGGWQMVAPQATAKRLKMPMEKVVLTVQEYGNTSAASVPMALDVAVRDGRIKRGQLLLLEAFGGGLTWGSALMRY